VGVVDRIITDLGVFDVTPQGLKVVELAPGVTGSTSGIGLGIAIELARQGAQIVMNGFGDVDAPRRQIEACGVQTAYHGADMSKPAEIEAMMAFAAEKFGGVDILVNNAGIQHVSPIESFPTERWDAIIAINLSSAFHTTRLAIPHMKQKNWGRIINIASVHGLVASRDKSAYVAAKHGIVGLTKVTALELATTGVTDAAGRRYIDASGGAAVSCLGHGHPDVLAAMHRQIDQLAYAHTSFFTTEVAEQLADQLVRTRRRA
jgi:NAD(P)-dependent dehydrogenase (short-subunit alcohol dehydrogenase family)